MTAADPRKEDRKVSCVNCDNEWTVNADEDFETARIKCLECGQGQAFGDARRDWEKKNIAQVGDIKIQLHKTRNKEGNSILDLYAIGKEIREKFHVTVLKDRRDRIVDVIYYDAGAGIYRRDAREKLNRIAESIFQNRAGTNLKNELFAHVRDQGSVYLHNWISKNPHIVVNNGVVNLAAYVKGEPCLESWSPSIHSFTKLDVDFDSNAPSDLLMAHLDSVIPDAGDRDRFQKFVGSFLEPWNYAHQKILVLTGSEGSGKTVTLRLFYKFFGAENIRAKSFQQLATNRFAIADLFGAIANICEELPGDTLRSVERLNSLTGGPVSGEHKGRDPFDFIQNAKIAAACNDLPPIDADTTTIRALMSRLLIIVFQGTIRGTLDEVHDYDEVILSQRPGILNWILAGYRKFVDASRHIDSSRSTDETLEFYIASADFEKYFLNGCTEKGTAADFVVKEDLWQAYLRAAKIMGHIPRTRQTFLSNAPAKFGGQLRSDRHMVGKKENGQPDQKWVFFGIKLKAEEKWFKTEGDQGD